MTLRDSFRVARDRSVPVFAVRKINTLVKCSCSFACICRVRPNWRTLARLTTNHCEQQQNKWRDSHAGDLSSMTLGKTERPHAAGTASAVLPRIILTELDREIAGPGWCVCADGLGRSPASDGNRTALEVQESPAFNGRRSFLTLRLLDVEWRSVVEKLPGLLEQERLRV